ncbi:MAG: transposase [Leptospiraceae bacterium]|nr:transposase [Leptospiraceae bacterium]
MKKRLFFVLYYFKTYPTFDVLGGAFGMDRGTACKWVHRYTEVLLEALQEMDLLPRRKFKDKQEFLNYFPEIRLVVLDGTERRRRRPKDSKEQKEYYSGKKIPFGKKPLHGRYKQKKFVCIKNLSR